MKLSSIFLLCTVFNLAISPASSAYEPESVEVVKRLQVEVVDTRNDKTIDDLVKKYNKVKSLEELIKSAINETSELQKQFNLSKEQKQKQLQKYKEEIRKAVGEMRMVTIRMYDSGEMVKFSSLIMEVMDVSNDEILKSSLEVLDYIFNMTIGTLVTLSILEINSSPEHHPLGTGLNFKNNDVLKYLLHPIFLQMTGAASLATLKLPLLETIKNLRGNLIINKAYGNLVSQFGSRYKDTSQKTLVENDQLREFYEVTLKKEYTHWIPTDKELEDFNHYIQIYKEYSNHYFEILTTTNYLLSIDSDKKSSLEKLKLKASQNYDKSLKLIRLAEGYYHFIKDNKIVLGTI